MKKLLLAALLTGVAITSYFANETPPESKLPWVLIIGDSISLGYTPHVAQMLNGIAVVKHHEGNAGPTTRGIADIDKWLGDTKWDIIHFNWGLWDMYGGLYEKHDRTPLMYEKRLETLVLRLKKTGAKLIWGTTTPICPEEERKYKVKISPATERQYLNAALRIMKEYKIQVNDLHAFMSPKWKKYSKADNDVHYTQDGYKELGKQVADTIKKNIIGKQKNAPDKE